MSTIGYVTHLGLLGGGGMVIGSEILNALSPEHMDLRPLEETRPVSLDITELTTAERKVPPLLISGRQNSMVFPYVADSHPMDAGNLADKDKLFSHVLIGERAVFGGSVGAGGDPEHCLKDIILPNKDAFLRFLQSQYRLGTSNVMLVLSADGGSGKALFDFHMDFRNDIIPKQFASAPISAIVMTPFNIDGKAVVKGGTSTRGQTSTVTMNYLASLVKHQRALGFTIVVDNDYALLNHDQNFKGKPIAPIITPMAKVILQGDFSEMRTVLAVSAAYKNANTSIVASLMPILLVGVRGGKKMIRVGEKAATGWDIADFLGQHKDGYIVPSYLAVGSKPAIDERLKGIGGVGGTEADKIGFLAALALNQTLAPFTRDSIRSIQFVVWSPYEGTTAEGVSAEVKDRIESRVKGYLKKDDLKISQLVMYGDDPLGMMDRAYLRMWAYINVDPEISAGLFAKKYGGG